MSDFLRYIVFIALVTIMVSLGQSPLVAHAGYDHTRTKRTPGESPRTRAQCHSAAIGL